MEHWDRLRGDQGFYWDDGLFRPSTDTFLLGSFPVLRRGEQVCDLGAGTGLLGALLLTREPSLTVTGLELREDACRLARRTAQRSGWQERLLCQQGDLRLREDLPPAGGFDLVVSNPPYVPSGEIERLMPEVSQYEPRLALDGGPDGLEPYRRLFELCARVLRRGGFFCVEYGGGAQTEALRALAPKAFRETVLLRDIAGCDRVIGWRFADVLPH